jgi:M6 family metalloprotease-like protein
MSRSILRHPVSSGHWPAIVFALILFQATVAPNIFAAGVGSARPRADSGDSAPGLPDLSAYRTVITAISTQIVKSASVRAGQSGYLGVNVAPDKRGRLMVEDVDAEGPAAKAGVQTGDILAKVSGRPLKDADQLRDLLQSQSPGDALVLLMERKKKSIELTATLGATSRPMKIGAQRTTLGVRLEDRKQGEGAEVAALTVGSPAARAGLKPGDVLLKLDGELISNHNYVRERLDEKQPGDMVKLAVHRDGEDLEIDARLAAAESTTEFFSRQLWKKDVYRLAVVLVEYADVKHNSRVSTNDWAEFAFGAPARPDQTNATGQAIYGSVSQYYNEISGAAFHLKGRVFDWIEMSRKRAEYAQGTNANDRSIFFTEALDRLREREGAKALEDFDGLLFLHAGDRVITANRGSLYWPHQGTTPYRGTRWSYFICPEGGRRMADISTACHEFGHSLGLPDLYARPENPGSEGLGVWCCMSNESGRGRPQHFGAWCKEQLGWLKPIVIDPAVKQKLILAPVEGSTNECFKVLVRPDGSEYLLLENRRRLGFDRSLPGEGLLIWRVVNGKPILEESHGIDGPAGPRLFPSAVPYPSRANNAFTPYTTPSSRSLLGGGTPVHITNIRELADGRITFQIGYEFE